MKKQTEKLAWKGMTLEVTTEPNSIVSRIAGEEYLSLKVTNPATSKPLINDAFAASLIQSAGGAVDFVDVMLSAQAA